MTVSTRVPTVAEARAEHNRRHTAFKLHLDRCRHECRTGGLCSTGRDLMVDADAAGWRLSDARERQRPDSASPDHPEAALAPDRADTLPGAAGLPRRQRRADLPIAP